jgi:hypothetical protein
MKKILGESDYVVGWVGYLRKRTDSIEGLRLGEGIQRKY